jgi:hypothetical protein
MRDLAVTLEELPDGPVTTYWCFRLAKRVVTPSHALTRSA